MTRTGIRNRRLLLGVCFAIACAVPACGDDAPAGSSNVDAHGMDANSGGAGGGTGGGAGHDAGTDHTPGTGGAGAGGSGTGGAAGGTGGTHAGGAGGSAPADASDALPPDTAVTSDGGDALAVSEAGAPDGASDAPSTMADTATDLGGALAASTCALAKPVDDGSLLEQEPLGLATQNGAGQCGGNATPGPTLYYTTTVEAGQLLTVQVWSEGGDRDWIPFVRVFTACDQGQCPSRSANGRVDGDGVVLNYANTTDAPQKMFIEVSAVGDPVGGATFSMDVSLIDSFANTECDSAEAVADGDMWTDQFLATGTGAPMLSGACALTGTTPALFYSVELPAHKTLHATTRSLQVNLTQATPHFLVLDGGCAATSCQMTSALNLANTTDAPKTVVFGVAGASGDPLLFDLDVEFLP
jgi:hypothetical protein